MLRGQLRSCADAEVELAKMNVESDLEVLSRNQKRSAQLKDALTNKFDPSARRVKIPFLKPEDELCCVVNLILPKKLRSQMLTTSTNY